MTYLTPHGHAQLPHDGIGGGIEDAPAGGGLYLRRNGAWQMHDPSEYLATSGGTVTGLLNVTGTLQAAGPTRALSFYQNNQETIDAVGPVSWRDRQYHYDKVYAYADPSDSAADLDAVGGRDYNDHRYAGHTETWSRTRNSFYGGNAVEVWLTDGRDTTVSYGPTLFSRSNERLYPTRSGVWIYHVTAAFENLSSGGTTGNRMLAIRKNSKTVYRVNEGNSKASAMTVSSIVVVGENQWLGVEMRVGHSSEADVYLTITRLGPA